MTKLRRHIDNYALSFLGLRTDTAMASVLDEQKNSPVHRYVLYHFLTLKSGFDGMSVTVSDLRMDYGGSLC